MKNVSFLFSMVTLAVLAACSSDPASVASDSTQVEDSTNVTASGICLKVVCPTPAKPGSLDTTFGQVNIFYPGTGKVITAFAQKDWANAMAIQADGKLVVAGTQGSLVRYNPNGGVDNTFGTAGETILPDASNWVNGPAMGIQSDGTIVVAATYEVGSSAASGDPFHFVPGVYLVNPNGTIRSYFLDPCGPVGVCDSFLGGLVIQSDNKIVLAASINVINGSGVSNFAAIRYNPDGSRDTMFGTGGIVSTSTYPGHFGQPTSVAIQSNGKIVVAGFDLPVDDSTSDMAVVRYNSNGSLDKTFDGDGIARVGFLGYSFDYAKAVKIQQNGKIVLAGYSNASGNNDFALARLNTNGSMDNTFDSDGILTTPIGLGNDAATSLGIQSDGKIVVGGKAETTADFDFALVRYKSNGSLDTTFGNSGKVTTSFGPYSEGAKALSIQSDGKIVLAGAGYNGTQHVFALARYNP
jgi:uncharacterized delta-60 repeat protein